MLADRDHLGWQVGSSDTILEGGHLRISSSKFHLNWTSSFRQQDFKTFSHNVKIVSTDGRCLGWRPVGSSDTILKGAHLRMCVLWSLFLTYKTAFISLFYVYFEKKYIGS